MIEERVFAIARSRSLYLAIAAVALVSERHRNANFLEDSASGERAENRNPEPRLPCFYPGG